MTGTIVPTSKPRVTQPSVGDFEPMVPSGIQLAFRGLLRRSQQNPTFRSPLRAIASCGISVRSPPAEPLRRRTLRPEYLQQSMSVIATDLASGERAYDCRSLDVTMVAVRHFGCS